MAELSTWGAVVSRPNGATDGSAESTGAVAVVSVNG